MSWFPKKFFIHHRFFSFQSLEVVSVLSVRASAAGNRLLPAAKNWAASLWANNSVPCGGTQAREKVK